MTKFPSGREIATALVPLVTLIGLVILAVFVFGRDVGDGASQMSILLATAVAALLARTVLGTPWSVLEQGIVKGVSSVTVSVFILLLIGMLSGTWMISGTVPTLISYGVRLIRPDCFLVTATVVCALVALVTGTSWSTVATVGVALMGIGTALGCSPLWSAGAIISGAYFGDKMSPLSDTTILASSSTRTDLFVHIRYMVQTTAPSLLLSLAVFAAVGLCRSDVTAAADAEKCVAGLATAFDLSPWTLVVPVVTLGLILLRVPSLAVLLASALLAGGVALVLQRPALLATVGETEPTAVNLYKAVMTVLFTSTHLDTGDEMLNRLVATRGMAGMLGTIWLILLAAAFGGVMYASGMLRTIARLIVSAIRGTVSMVGATAFTGVLMNAAMGDQYLSILVTADIFRDVYRERGHESRLLSRTIEDSSTVTSVLVPWNTCAMAQSASLGIATVDYLPYCIFNLLSPITTIVVAAIGKGIRRVRILV